MKMSESTSKIIYSVHPDYALQYSNWQKFRFVMDGGTDFIEEYLASFSSRESTADFEARKSITPVPGFAAASIIDIKNAIFQRMVDITRVNGSESYHKVVSGEIGGVDLLGASMNYFIGNEVLPELLSMGKVGVYTDMPLLTKPASINDTRHIHPYFYTYKAEDIRNWRMSRHGEFMEFDMLLLKENILTYDDVFFLPSKDTVQYRLLTRQNGKVQARLFDYEGIEVDEITLDIDRIPFTLFEINQSLLQNIANHQIALLNLESSDISYALLSNFPFYVEQQSNTQSPHLKSQEDTDGDTRRDIDVGGTVGRTYAKGLNEPTFIHPSSEPLTASMQKQKQLKDDIRVLINLALSAVQPKFASAESKQMDEHGLESGLSFLGMVLEHGERQLASFYTIYEQDGSVATITYPDRYALKSDADRITEAEKLHDIAITIPSNLAQKEINKFIAKKLMDSKIPQKVMEDVINEIDKAKYMTSDPETIHTDLEKGLVSTETASKARGYDSKKEVPKAEADHAKRIARIKSAQEGARGVDDLSANSDEGKEEKANSQNPDNQDNTKKPVRGEEK